MSPETHTIFRPSSKDNYWWLIQRMESFCRDLLKEAICIKRLHMADFRQATCSAGAPPKQAAVLNMSPLVCMPLWGPMLRVCCTVTKLASGHLITCHHALPTWWAHWWLKRQCHSGRDVSQYDWELVCKSRNANRRVPQLHAYEAQTFVPSRRPTATQMDSSSRLGWHETMGGREAKWHCVEETAARKLTWSWQVTRLVSTDTRSCRMHGLSHRDCVWQHRRGWPPKHWMKHDIQYIIGQVYWQLQRVYIVSKCHELW